MDIISSIVGKINSFLWDFALLFLLCGTGIYFTIRLKFVQIAKFKDGWDKHYTLTSTQNAGHFTHTGNTLPKLLETTVSMHGRAVTIGMKLSN